MKIRTRFNKKIFGFSLLFFIAYLTQVIFVENRMATFLENMINYHIKMVQSIYNIEIEKNNGVLNTEAIYDLNNRLFLEECIIYSNHGFINNKSRFEKIDFRDSFDTGEIIEFNGSAYALLSLSIQKYTVYTYFSLEKIAPGFYRQHGLIRGASLVFSLIIYFILLYFLIANENFKSRYTQLSDQLKEGIFSTDSDLNIFSSNTMFGKIFNKEKIVGTNLREYFEDSSFLGRLQIDGKLSSKGKGIIRKSSGTKTIFPVQIEAVRGNRFGNRFGFDGVVRDITDDEKQQDRKFREMKMQSMGNLTAGIAHDFNNILQILSDRLMMFSTTCDKCMTEKQKNHIADAFRQVDVAKDMIKSLMTFTRQSYITKTNFDAHEAFLKVTSILQINFEKNGIDYRVIQDCDHCYINGNEAQILMSIQNLILNSIDAVANKTDKIVVSKISNKRFETPEQMFNGVAPEGEYVSISVSDSGGGISEQNMKKIFDPYFTTKGKHGSGVGLNVVLGSVESMNGFLQVENTVSGAKFTLYFPVISDANVTTVAKPMFYTSNLRNIMIVEDEEDIREQIAKTMSSHFSLDIIQAPNGLIAMEYIKRGDISLVITDLRMPGMDGYELYKRIRILDKNIPVIVITGNYDPVKLNAIISEGTYVIQKPFHPKELLELFS